MAHLKQKSSRRNKECTRSVKKKSGPAKGTKYAARRTRSHDEFRRSGHNDGSEAGSSSSSSRSALVGMRRTASSGDSCVPFPLGTIDSSQIHGTPYRFVPHASPRVGHRTSFPPGRLRFLPPGEVGVGVRREVNRDGVAGAAASAGVVAGGGIKDAGDDAGVGVGFATRPGEEFSNQYHQLGGGGSSGGDGGGVGGTGGNDTESQQLIRNFPGVLQVRGVTTGRCLCSKLIFRPTKKGPAPAPHQPCEESTHSSLNVIIRRILAADRLYVRACVCVLNLPKIYERLDYAWFRTTNAKPATQRGFNQP